MSWGDITVHKVRHFDWKGPEGFAFFLCRHSVQIVGWAGGFGFKILKWYPVRSDAPATSFWMFWGGVHGSEANRIG